MKIGLIRKGVVFSIILLFIGVGIQPVLAGSSFATKLDYEEGYIDYQVSDGYSLLKAKLLLNRVKVIVNFISFKFEDTPEIEEKCQETLKVINHYYPLIDFVVICNIIYDIMTPIVELYYWSLEVYYDLEEISMFLANMFEVSVMYPIIGMIGICYSTGMLFGCWGE